MIKNIRIKLAAILLVSVIMFANKANAQISIGPRLGLNMSSLTGADPGSGASKSMAIGVVGGVSANFGINDMWSIQPELLFSMQGEKITFGSDYSSLNLNYLNIPVLAKFTIGSGDAKGFITLGPQFGYMMSASETDNIGGSKNTTSVTDFTDVNRVDVGVSVGIGGSYKMGPGSLQLDLRYILGFTDINKGSITSSSDYKAEDNRTFMVSLAYMFALGGK